MAECTALKICGAFALELSLDGPLLSRGDSNGFWGLLAKDGETNVRSKAVASRNIETSGGDMVQNEEREEREMGINLR